MTGQRSNQLNYVPTRQINEMRNRQCLCGFAHLHRIASGAAKRARFLSEPLQYPNSFPGNAKDLPLPTALSSRNLSRRLDCGFCQRQVNGHRRMIRDAVFNRVVQFAHRNRKMGSEAVALSRSPWIVDKGLDEDPV